MLADSGVAGKPDSFYRRVSRSWWSQHWGLTQHPDAKVEDRAFLKAALQEGRNKTPLFGMRLMQQDHPDMIAQLAGLAPDAPTDRARIEAALGRTLFIHLRRKDTVAQAVSYVKAQQSGLWHKGPDGQEIERTHAQEPARYDPAAIAQTLTEFQDQNTAWRTWFAAQNITPLKLEYETLAQAPQTVLAAVLERLGQDTTRARHVTPGTAKMADAESAAWIAQFRSATKP